MRTISKLALITFVTLTAFASRAQAQGACGLVTKQEVSEAAGFAVDVVTPQTVGGASSCIYGAKTRQSVQVRTYSGEQAAGADAMCRGGMPLRGLGDKACLVKRGPALTMQVTKGSTVLVVLWLNAPADGSEQGLRRITVKALARM